ATATLACPPLEPQPSACVLLSVLLIGSCEGRNATICFGFVLSSVGCRSPCSPPPCTPLMSKRRGSSKQYAGTNGVPRPAPSSLASKPSALRVCATKLHVARSCRLASPVVTHRASGLAWCSACGLSPPPPDARKQFCSSSPSSAVPPPSLPRCATLRAARPADPSRASRLGAESLRTPSHSKSTVAGSNPSRALATTNTRRRRCAKAKYWASRVRQAIARRGPYTAPAFAHLPPGARSGSSSPARPARKHPKALSLVERTPGTFSQKTIAGGRPS